MASIQERRNKAGQLISFSIRVHRGRSADGTQLKPYTATFDVPKTWSETTARKKAADFAATFEKQCKEGLASDTRLRFAAYCDYVINLKEQRGAKHSTITRYRDLTARIYPEIGQIKLCDLRVDHLNDLYTKLAKNGLNKRTGGKLSPKTIIEHHRLISTVMDQACRECLVPFNVASRATPPKLEQKEVNYFRPEQIAAITEALEQEPFKWKMLVHLLLITGARRGEILGLKWQYVDFKNNRIYICNNLLYSPDIGIYEDTPKTAKSKRYISLPEETMHLLKEHKRAQTKERLKMGAYYEDRDFVFAHENGSPLHPDSITTYLTRFSRKYNLPHINPHAFRHTMASTLYFNGAKTAAVSKRLGHAQNSTTENIYIHIIDQADQKNADILADVLLRNA